MSRLKNLVAAIGVLFVLAFGSVAQARPAFDALSAADEARVERGEVVVNVEKTDSPLKHFRVVGEIPASARRTYEVFTDFPRYAEIFHLKESKVVREEGNARHVRAIISAPWPFGDKWVINETLLSPGDYSFSFQRVEGTVTEYVGFVRIEPLAADRCRVFYVAKVDPGIPFLPTWLLNHVQASMLPDTIHHVRSFLKRPSEATSSSGR